MEHMVVFGSGLLVLVVIWVLANVILLRKSQTSSSPKRSEVVPRGTAGTDAEVESDDRGVDETDGFDPPGEYDIEHEIPLAPIQPPLDEEGSLHEEVQSQGSVDTAINVDGSETWELLVERLKELQMVEGWMVFEGTNLLVSDPPFDERFHQTTVQYIEALRNLQLELGLTELELSSVVARQGMTRVYRVPTDVYIFVFLNRDADLTPVNRLFAFES